MFAPPRTERLLLRAPRLDDLDALVARRNHPEVAALQDWSTPYPRERAEAALRDAIAAGGPTVDEFWMITIADADDTTVLGDLVVKLECAGRNAEVGYTLARDAWGRGYATEALDALVDWLFEQPALSRVHAMLHPDNVASAAVLERTGFLFEGHTRLSYWLDGDNSDDWIYGQTRADWTAWRNRPRAQPTHVELVEIDASNQYSVRRLGVHRSQLRFVAPVVDSMADALFPEVIDGAPVDPWMRAVRADGELVGFVMVALVTEAHPEPYLWRLLVDRRHQGRGIGRRILDLVVEEQRATGATSLLTSWVEGRGSPRPFYERCGFVETGEVVDGETEGRLAFARRAPSAD